MSQNTAAGGRKATLMAPKANAFHRLRDTIHASRAHAIRTASKELERVLGMEYNRNQLHNWAATAHRAPSWPSTDSAVRWTATSARAAHKACKRRGPRATNQEESA